MDNLKIIVFSLIVIDVFASFISIIDMIPIGKHRFKLRFPFLITLIIIVLQTKQRNKVFYCKTCHKNLYYPDVTAECYCKTTHKLKFVGFSGVLNYNCPNKKCKKRKIIGFGRYDRTMFSRLNPYGKRMQAKRLLVCRICGNMISGEPVMNFSLYSSNIELAKNYREDFFYHSFGPAKENKDLHISPVDVKVLKDIDHHYEHGAGKLGSNSVSEVPIQLHFKTQNKNVNQTLYQFNMAVALNADNKLIASEAIIILLDGNSKSAERQSVVDNFLVDIQQINIEGSVWKKPVLVGICCNNVKRLEDEIDGGKINSADDCEEICRRFLNEENNDDIINRLNGNVANVRYFLYRTGTAEKGTQGKVYNVVNPVQALTYAVQSEMKHIWPPVSNGHCPKM